MLQKNFRLISILLLIALVISLLFYPRVSAWLAIVLLLLTISIAVFFSIQQHLPLYKQGQLGRLEFARNVLIDVLGLLLTIGAASYVGELAGKQLGEIYNLWIGLIVGMAAAFLTAWLVRKLWNRLIKTFYASAHSA